MASDMGVPFLGRIPIDPCIGIACDEGEPHVIRNADSETAKAFSLTVESILSIEKGTNEIKEKESSIMRIAIPVAEGKLAMHFGHCEQFALIDTDPETKTIVKVAMETPPAHEPGVLPKWLAEKGANVIIGGGMGSRAQSLFAEQKIEVVVGAPADLPENIVKAYLAGTLASGENVCDH
jgi:predicted Fe-Mo cluster-binding NifX family protein